MGTTDHRFNNDPAGMSLKRILALVGLATAGYGAFYLLWFWETPLGQVPLLDGRENVLLAEAIAQGRLAAEPFFRAMLYPAALSMFFRAGLPAETMMIAVGILGLLCHLLSALLVSYMASKMLNSSKAALLSGLLFGLYPVGVYFAADPLDTCFSLAFFLAGLALLVSGFASTGESPIACRTWPPVLYALSAGFCWALAALARPNFLIVLVLAPLLVYYAQKETPPLSLQQVEQTHWFGSLSRIRLTVAIMSWLGALPPMLVYAGWQYSVCGQPGVVPWQGAFSLWAANRAGANGKYYAQQTLLAYGGSYQNPARLEAEMLFIKETGARPPLDLRAMNQYWRSQAVREIETNLIAWFKLQCRKCYYFLNDFEQYNNKTYLFHKQRCPWLNWNPLGWWLIAVAGSAGWLWMLRQQRKMAVLLGGVMLAYLAGAILFFASDRFRYPLVPFVCLCSGALMTWTRPLWSRISRSWRILGVGIPTAVGILALTSWFDARDIGTFLQDKLLLAHACLRTGLDAEALRWTDEVLHQDASRSDARQIAALAKFNLDLTGHQLITGRKGWEDVISDLGDPAQFSPAVSWIWAVAQWKLGNREAAVSAWRQIVHRAENRTASDALAMLVLSGEATEFEKNELLKRNWKHQGPYLLLARIRLEGAAFEREARQSLKKEELEVIGQRIDRLLFIIVGSPPLGQ